MDSVIRKKKRNICYLIRIFLTYLSIDPNSPYIVGYHQLYVMWKVRIPNCLLFWQEGNTCTAMNHSSRLCFGQLAAYIMYEKGCTKHVHHPLTIMSIWKEIETGVYFLSRNCVVIMSLWACGDAVGWGIPLQARRSRVRFTIDLLQFLIDIILPAALWPWGWLSL
jgi:hypothetical protein